jgi:hypothetical protein
VDQGHGLDALNEVQLRQQGIGDRGRRGPALDLDPLALAVAELGGQGVAGRRAATGGAAVGDDRGDHPDGHGGDEQGENQTADGAETGPGVVCLPAVRQAAALTCRQDWINIGHHRA